MQTTHNTPFDLAEQFIRFTNASIFLTGKAGTGKTTFLRHIVSSVPKQLVVAAPTGVAAMNANGVTLHSLFQLPFGPFLPTTGMPINTGVGVDWRNQKTLMRTMRMANNKRAMLRRLELLIIDEVSMVRADMLDALDSILRSVRKNRQVPFGGVQVLLIGDLRQLAPVVKPDEWTLLQQYYKSPYFFDAKVMQQVQLVNVELTKVFRQSDEIFINLLNRLRNNRISSDDLVLLEKKYMPNFQPPKDDHYITLCSHNYQANAINEKYLAALPGRERTFSAKVEDDFPPYLFPAEENLRLKVGAQVMFIRNDTGEDRRYYNGKIGTVDRFSDEGVVVRFPDEVDTIEVTPQDWENIKYQHDEETNKIKEEVVGRFIQYPLRLSWAITIHKSQGLTFEKAIVDAGASFAPGQVYVALSRLTSLDGLVLKSRIPAERITTDEGVSHYLTSFEPEDKLQEIFQQRKREHVRQLMFNTFSYQKLQMEWREFHQSLPSKKHKNKAVLLEWSDDFQLSLREIEEVCKKFEVYLLQKWPPNADVPISSMQRALDACKYFITQNREKLEAALKVQINRFQEESTSKSLMNGILGIRVLVEEKRNQLLQTERMIQALMEGKKAEDALQSRWSEKESYSEVPEKKKKKSSGSSKRKEESTDKTKSTKKKPFKSAYKGQSMDITCEMFLSGKSTEEIAVERDLAFGTVEGHILYLVKNKRLPKDALVNAECEAQISKAVHAVLANRPADSDEPLALKDIKALLSDDITFTQIRLVRDNILKEIMPSKVDA
ncbi:MAG: AAA family ATPase [Cryomorphaceae bacterium]|nr:AAA family ATPase [Cryomorphaceae bacterium]